jgi:DNA topoisomerase IB
MGERCGEAVCADALALDPETQLVVDAAESAGLRYVSDDEPGLRRRKTGKGFSYKKPDGKSVRDKATRERIRKLAIPTCLYGRLDLLTRERSHPSNGP